MNLPSELDLQKIISRYEKIGFRRRDRANSSQEKEMFLDLSNVWKAKKKSPCQQYQAIRESTMFSD